MESWNQKWKLTENETKYKLDHYISSFVSSFLVPMKTSLEWKMLFLPYFYFLFTFQFPQIWWSKQNSWQQKKSKKKLSLFQNVNWADGWLLNINILLSSCIYLWFDLVCYYSIPWTDGPRQSHQDPSWWLGHEGRGPQSLQLQPLTMSSFWLLSPDKEVF